MTAAAINCIYTGDAIATMALWPANFVDTLITDPPYGLQFMGKDWDDDVPGIHFWAEMLRVCKPGACLLAFGGTRTWHHLAIAIEKAGWQIRDCMMWLYGSGFPKSLDISKAVDKATGAERFITQSGKTKAPEYAGKFDQAGSVERERRDIPATDLAREWSGWGTALKPAWEPIIVAMKPLDGTFAQNAEKWGVAGINVDGGRIDSPVLDSERRTSPCGKGIIFAGGHPNGGDRHNPKGRWPANLILDEEAGEMLDEQTGELKSGALNSGHRQGSGMFMDNDGKTILRNYGNDSGGASRFFYVAKADRFERNEGCDELPKKTSGMISNTSGQHITRRDGGAPEPSGNNHPTVKPLSLMKYLCMLTKTPTGGIVLDPFCGSGTTLWAAEFHNRPWIGIEVNAEYVKIAEARIARERAQIKLAL